MCHICESMGDGKIWYLNPRNYGRRLYTRRKKGVYTKHIAMDEEFGFGASSIGLIDKTLMARAEKDEKTYLEGLESLNTKFFPQLAQQVLTLEDAKKVVDLASPLGLMSCICRLGGCGREERCEEEYSCLGIGSGMFKWQRWPTRYKGGVKFVTPEEAKKWLEKWNKRGLVQMVMQYGTGYIGGICNCDYPDCYSMRRNFDYDMRYVYKGHHVAKVDYSHCTGCRKCMGRCYFSALSFETTGNRAQIDAFKCAGCGLCATVCPTDAIEMLPRADNPGIKDNWLIKGNRTMPEKVPGIRIDYTKCKTPLDCKKCLSTCPELVYWVEPIAQRVRKLKEATGEDYHVYPLYRDMCTSCMDCVKACPVGAITITEEGAAQ